MVQITSDGEIIIGNGINLTSEKKIINGTNLLTDGTIILNLQDHTIPVYEIASNLQSKALLNTQINYDIEIDCSNNADPGHSLIVDLNIPEGFTLIKATSNEGTYNATTGIWTLVMKDQQATLNLLLEATTAGTWTQTVTLDGTSVTISSTCTISATDTDGNINSYEILDSSNYPVLTANLQNGKQYTVIMYSRIHDTGVSGIHAGIKNGRFSLLNGIKTIWSNRATVQDTITKTTVVFTYDSDYPIIISRHDQYETISTAGQARWYGLCIREGFNKEYNESANLLTNPAGLLDDTNFSEITLEGNSESAEYLYSVSVPQLTGDKNPFFTGLQLMINSFAQSNSSIEVQILSSTGKVSNIESTFIERSDQISFGDPAYLWGLTDDDIQDQTLQILIKVINSSRITQTFSYANLQLYMYYQDDLTLGKLGFSFNGVHSRNYNLILSDDDTPIGLNKKITTLSVEKTDGVLITDDSSGGKEIQLTPVLVDTSLPHAQIMLNNIAEWLSSEKNTYNIPELGELIFDYNPSMVYMAVLSKQITVDKNHPKITLKINFLVPSGVALNITPRICGVTGVNRGLKKVRPVITVETDVSDSITITENNTEDSITIDYGFPANSIITIDCENESITDENDTEYVEEIAGNSIWIGIPGKASFSFASTGGSIRSIVFREGF